MEAGDQVENLIKVWEKDGNPTRFELGDSVDGGRQCKLCCPNIIKVCVAKLFTISVVCALVT